MGFPAKLDVVSALQVRHDFSEPDTVRLSRLCAIPSRVFLHHKADRAIREHLAVFR
jgi:hypothetical protein